MKVSLLKSHFFERHAHRNVSPSKRSIGGKIIMKFEHVDNVKRTINYDTHWVKKASSP